MKTTPLISNGSDPQDNGDDLDAVAKPTKPVSDTGGATPLTPPEMRLIISCAMTTMFLSVLDQTIVATSLPSIAADLGNFSLISWVITSYLLTSSCATLIVGKISDLYGRRLILRACLVIFIVSSILCAIAPNLLFLIGARMLQGIGGGALATLAQTVVSDIVPPRERGRYSAYFAITWGCGSALGPLLGGLLTQYLGWPFIFWINLPLGLGALFLADRALGKLPISHHRSRVNYSSILTLSGTTIGLLLVLSLGGKRFAWESWQILVLAAAAMIMGALFIWQQTHWDDPILPPRFFKDRVIRPAITVNFVMYAGFLTIVSLTPIFFQIALQVSVGRSGLLMIPLMIAMATGAFCTGGYIRRSGRYKLPPLIGLPLAAAMAASIALFADHISAPTVSVLLAVFGIGMGFSLPCCQIAAQNATDSRDLGVLNGSITFARVLGGSLGIAAASAFVLAIAADALPHTGEAVDIETLTRHVLSPDTRHAIAKAFGVVFVGVSFIILTGFAAFTRIEERELRRDFPAGIAQASD